MNAAPAIVESGEVRSSISLHSTQASCHASDTTALDDAKQVALARVDAVLGDEQWTWVRELLEAVDSVEMRQAAQLTFLSLLEATTSEAVEAALDDLETWRSGVNASEKASRQLADASRTLFLLGADKLLAISQSCATSSLES
ncbi:hypothetical protein PybrP1_011427 [[Pythium] brassicae (nom. inval.)]|nr:hypothetical protein PybrP1_011427 [[Pythium] brassicae (nom. inval.)]